MPNLFPAFALPRLSARSSLALCFFLLLAFFLFLGFSLPPVFPDFLGSHFSFPSAFASVRTSSARLAFDFSAFLFPLDLHPPSGTLSLLPLGRLLSSLRFPSFFFRSGSLSPLLRSRLHRSDDFLSLPFPSGTQQHFFA